MRLSTAPLIYLLRLVVIALLLLTATGLSAAVSAADDARCIGCGCDCGGTCDGSTCPPGPLCADAPQCVVIAPLTLVVGLRVACSVPNFFATDARLPESAFADGVFHPPRFIR